jgi:hypothetical protein
VQGETEKEDLTIARSSLLEAGQFAQVEITHERGGGQVFIFA